MAVRAEQAKTLSKVAATLHVNITDWSGSSWTVQGPSGSTEVVETLPQVWESIERVSGRKLEPLSDAIINAFAPNA
ncbi:hypothetical protein [Paraburkholderia franconis]|uniref:hypothetical protein n=1 Tax=Paraburkholderia franconis TaxID=2654983 RepID=UPI00187BB3E5|nr:hypothetical protein [Paraburkholderia franconis]